MGTGGTVVTGHTRSKRQTDSLYNFSTDEADLAFYLGFIFDGYSEYSSLADHETLGDFAEISVHRSPKMRLYDPTEPMVFEKGQNIAIMVSFNIYMVYYIIITLRCNSLLDYWKTIIRVYNILFILLHLQHF